MRARPGAGTRTRALTTQIAKIEADVWVLTESHRELAPAPSYQLVASSESAPDLDGVGGERWVTIWSRVHAEEAALGADPERTAAVKVSLSDGGALLVVGTVLPWLADSRHETLRGADAFCDALKGQAAAWRRLQAAHGGAPLCVAGDFNQDLSQRHYHGSKRGRTELTRALEETGLVCLTASPHDPLAAASSHASIDHLCVSASLLAAGRPAASTWPEPPWQLAVCL